MAERGEAGTRNKAKRAAGKRSGKKLGEWGSRGTPWRERRSRLKAAFEQIEEYEQYLSRKLIEGLSSVDGVTIHGVTDLNRLSQRVPTVSFTHRWKTPHEIALYLGEQGIFVWHGNYYALPLTEAPRLEPHAMAPAGAMHYNTPPEVARLVAAPRDMK